MRPIASPRRQHYVPRLLLARFARERKPGKFQISVFDKATERQFPTSIENVAVESDFNTLERGGLRFCLESAMADIESGAAPHLASIIEHGAISQLAPDARQEICLFAALQFVRGTDFRARFAQMVEGTRQRIVRVTGVDPLPASVDQVRDDDEFKAATFGVILESLAEFAALFAVKRVLLFRRCPDAEFQIGDSPITLTNQNSFRPYGNIGLAVRGIQINLPISADYSLGFWCPSVLEEAADRLERSRQFVRSTDGYAVLAEPDRPSETEATRAAIATALPEVDSLVTGAETGVAIDCSLDHVTHFNSLQISNAERWVMSRNGDFSLARRMIGDDEKFRTGHRIEVA